MIVDTSAIVVILRAEPDAADYAWATEGAATQRPSAATSWSGGSHRRQ